VDYRMELKAMLHGPVLLDEELSRHTSMGVGGKADCLILPDDADELCAAVAHLKARGIPFLPMGNGTNLVVRDGGYRGTLVAMKNLRSLAAREEADGRVVISAGAGLNLAELVSFTVREALTGLEFCAGIPGSVGGAVSMNAGAFGRELKDVLATVSLLDEEGAFREMPAATLAFSYRSLALSPGTIVTGASFRMEHGCREEIAGRVGEIMTLRKMKHPLEFPSAGSVFKNPKDMPAGRLIDEVGLKGARIGDAMISEKHGNFIVNRGHAKAADILALIALSRERVKRERGIDLELEVRIIGE
jgi:UDP-N-acetylmuramate dehydrogenase